LRRVALAISRIVAYSNQLDIDSQLLARAQRQAQPVAEDLEEGSMGSRLLAELLSDFAIKIGVGGAPHSPHAASAQLGDDAVVSGGMLKAPRQFQASYHLPAG